MLWVVGSVAGVAGSTVAYWLARQGFQPTGVERAHGLRTSGNPVEIRGPALRVAAAMGIAPRLCEAATQTAAMTLMGSAGRRVARVALPATRNGAQAREIVPRGGLAAIVSEAARDDAELLFGDEIVALDQDGHGVDVTFCPAATLRPGPRRDGLRSAVRRLAVGPEREFVRHAGMYAATMPLGGPVDHPHEVMMYNTPGRLVSIHPVAATR